MAKIIVLVSGEGTNLHAIIEACNGHVINGKVTLVVSNKENVGALTRAQMYDIPTLCSLYNPKTMLRADYDEQLIQTINQYEYDLIVCAGWMHLLSNHFLTSVKSPIINLHPALPGQFPGKNSIASAYNAFKEGKTIKTGVMVHHVVEEMDAGSVVEQYEINISKDDTLQSLENRVKYCEKFVLVNAINKVLNTPKKTQEKYPLIYQGKVRDVHDLGYGLLAMVQTNRQSAFDRHICEIPIKGSILTNASAWWFNKTKHIVDNHYVYSKDNVMVVKKCVPFKIEVVVRGYITGSTSTSLWTHYQKGVRNYCGIDFPDGLVKNQKLEYNVVTPTTKGDVDELITEKEIVEKNYMTQNQWDFIKEKALELFNFGQVIANQKGLILVDTKYEFGLDSSNNVLLIDEIHTCDSSRYWLLDTYNDKFNKGQEPDKFDKDLVRDYVNKKCNPYVDPIPEIPNDLIEKTSNVYNTFHRMLIGKLCALELSNPKELFDGYFDDYHKQIVVIVAGSDRDAKWIDTIKSELNKFNIYSKTYIASAHRNTQMVVDIVKKYDGYKDRQIMFVCVAGMTNALGGTVAAQSRYPTFACPPFKDQTDMQVNIWSSIINPTNVPTITVLQPVNLALAINRIFAFGK